MSGKQERGRGVGFILFEEKAEKEAGVGSWRVVTLERERGPEESDGISGAPRWGPRASDTERGGGAGAADAEADAGHGASSEAECARQR